jgi:hypothetical protein
MKKVTLKTDESLIKRLTEAAKIKLTKEEIEKQRVSIIFSGMPKESAMSKVDIERALQKAS